MAVRLLVFLGLISMVTSCVPPDCYYSTQPSRVVWDLTNPWIILIIALSVLFFIILLVLFVWFCCYCCYRSNVSVAPSVVRRIIRVREPCKQIVRPRPRVLHHITPPPLAPICSDPPSEKIVVVPPPCPQPPQTLLLTVSEGLNSKASGPDMTTRIERPLTFTLMAQPDGIRQSGLRVHDHMNHISGYVDCTCRDCCEDH